MLHSLRELEAELVKVIDDIQSVTAQLYECDEAKLIREHNFGQQSAYSDCLRRIRKIIKEGQ